MAPNSGVNDAVARVALADLATKVKDGKKPTKNLDRLLELLGQKRRGAVVNARLARLLDEFGLRTRPDFRDASLQTRLTFELAEESKDPLSEPGREEVEQQPRADDSGAESSQPHREDDPSASIRRDGSNYRVSRFLTEEKRSAVKSVAPGTSIKACLQIMEKHKFSQLPVMPDKKRVVGMLSWRSIGKAYAFGRSPERAEDCCEEAVWVNAGDGFTKLISSLQIHDAVLVKQGREFVAIFTSADIADLYAELADSFIVLGEIEDLLRSILERGAFTASELRDICGEYESGEINRIDDLSFGSYLRILASEERWQRLRLMLDRSSFVADLDQTREIRNAVMHFDPDGLTPEQLKHLHGVCDLLRSTLSESPPVGIANQA